MHWTYYNEAYTINANELVMRADLNLGSVYMRRASPDTRAGPLKRDDFQPGFI